ncbi:Methionine-binding lipoprotein MetQ precursor [compost metagenome]
MFSLTLVVMLAACGSDNNASSGSAASTAPSAGASSAPSAAEPVTLVIGASPVPHAEILKAIAPQLEAEGIKLEIKEFTDYVQPNVQLAEG